MSNGESIQIIRQKIDQIDEKILLLLKKRIDFMQKIGKIKKQSSLSIRDNQRERKKLKIIEEKAKKIGLPVQLINQLWTSLFTHSEEIEK